MAQAQSNDSDMRTQSFSTRTAVLGKRRASELDASDDSKIAPHEQVSNLKTSKCSTTVSSSVSSSASSSSHNPISFNSKTRAFAELSNFYPFVNHNSLGLKSITVRLGNIPARLQAQSGHFGADADDGSDGGGGCDFIECGSVEAAYLLGKYLLYVDADYALQVLFLARHGNAKSVKSLGSKTAYVAWKARTASVTKVRAGELYDHAQIGFRAQNFQLMASCLWSKFTLNPRLADLLLSTHDCELHESGRPSVWTSSGADMLGKLLMHVRAHLRAQTPAESVEQVLTDMPKLE